MTISTARVPLPDHNQQTFETCIALALQLVASIELAPAVGDQAPTSEHLLNFARQLDRHADDIALLSGQPHANIPGQGWARYQDLRGAGAPPLQAAYHALHTAAYLGLDGGQATAVMLSVVACGVRELAMAGRERTYH
ncbi:hypothetical protein [Deinococcus sp. NW-56]|uniref:hypothetical protein n=1 Tax=Deinococcus sp. NW-56 TaxID=2080419 RepID=UPI000CF48E0D|nr:hypothetical protein [Deinococcus sp. NW-56]